MTKKQIAEIERATSESLLTAALIAVAEVLKTNRSGAALEASKMVWNARERFAIPRKRSGYASRAGRRQSAERNAR